MTLVLHVFQPYRFFQQSQLRHRRVTTCATTILTSASAPARSCATHSIDTRANADNSSMADAVATATILPLCTNAVVDAMSKGHRERNLTYVNKFREILRVKKLIRRSFKFFYQPEKIQKTRLKPQKQACSQLSDFYSPVERRTLSVLAPQLSPNICEHPIEHGDCSGAFARFAYDIVINACRSFAYGGCGGSVFGSPKAENKNLDPKNKFKGQYQKKF